CFEAVVPRALRRFAPDLIVVQAGADMHHRDPLADLSLTLRGMRRAYERLGELADEVTGGRLVLTGGGGCDAYRTVPRGWALAGSCPTRCRPRGARSGGGGWAWTCPRRSPTTSRSRRPVRLRSRAATARWRSGSSSSSRRSGARRRPRERRWRRGRPAAAREAAAGAGGLGGSMRVGFIGLGTMGAPMARRLLEAGHDVVVHNRTREREEPLAALGAGRAASPRECAAGREVVFTMV